MTVHEVLPNYPLAIEPAEGQVREDLAKLLFGIYRTTDVNEAATLASFDHWIICDVIFDDDADTDADDPQLPIWILGNLKDQGI